MKDKRKIQGEQTRAAIIEAAASLFQKHGYAATSLRQLIEESGQPKGSIYFHFPGGKHEIAMEAAAKNADQISALICYAFENRESLSDAISITCAEFSKRLTETEFVEGCPMAPLATITLEDSQDLRQLCGQRYEAWLETIELSIQRYGIANTDASAVASLILSSIQGAVLLSQGRCNTQALDSLPASLAKLF